MIKVLLLAVLLASTSVICPTTLHVAAGTAVASGTTTITNTLTVAASGSFPAAGAVITWSRATTTFTITGASIPAADQAISRGFAVGFSDQAATTMGVNGFVGGLAVGAGTTPAVANILPA
jgi:hypothetical protein